MRTKAIQCPVCGWNQGVVIVPPTEPTEDVSCPRCGNFLISFEAKTILKDMSLESKAPLIGLLRERSLRGLEPLTIKTDNFENLMAERRAISLPERVDHFLLNLSLLTASPGDYVTIHFERDFPLGYCEKVEGLYFIRDILVEDKLIQLKGETTDQYRLTLTGWARAAELQRGAIDSSAVFVAMSFKPEWDTAWKEGIRSAIEEDCGYMALRVDAVEHAEDINDRIIAEIRRSKFMVADFSANPGGVYLEAGFEMGLGRTVIWTCQDDDERKKALHFDISHYNFIFWKDPADLRKRLRDRILALFGEGPRHEPGR